MSIRRAPVSFFENPNSCLTRTRICKAGSQRMSEPIVVGIDIAKETFDVSWGDESRSFSNADAGYEELIGLLRPLGVELILMEATGGYEAACACALQAAGFPVA